MKRVFSLFAVIVFTISMFAQSPEKMSYQAVIRNSSDVLVTNTNISMQISILQSTASGAEVYVETQMPTTNANGLVSIEIGGDDATVVSGDFASINWANDIYFIKTETDLTGGTSYTITGVSQMLSVPYALHAKTAESISGGITETDPVYAGSEAANITTGDISNLGNLSGTNTGDQDGSETKITAGANVSVTGVGTSESPYVIGNPTLTIGQTYQGGIIFWLDETGQHGLIASPVDQSTAIVWISGYATSTRILASADGIGAGRSNTDLMLANQVFDDGTTTAARLCNEYQSGGYGDWYLPSKYELNLLQSQKNAVGGFVSGFYWSSNEFDKNNAWMQGFDDGFQIGNGKGNPGHVRAIRAF